MLGVYERSVEEAPGLVFRQEETGMFMGLRERARRKQEVEDIGEMREVAVGTGPGEQEKTRQ